MSAAERVVAEGAFETGRGAEEDDEDADAAAGAARGAEGDPPVTVVRSTRSTKDEDLMKT